MRRILFICMMVLVTAVSVSAQSRHRHQHKDTVVTEQSANKSDEIVVYSDTISSSDEDLMNDAVVISDDDDNSRHSVTDENRLDPSRFSDPLSYYVALWGAGVGGVLIAISILIAILLFFLLPIIVVYAIFRYLYKRHKDRMELEKKAIETGHTMRNTGPSFVYNDTVMHVRGIRNVSIGAGLVLMFMCWHNLFLSGIGFLILCIGIGQLFIARISGRKNDSDNSPDDTFHNDFTK